MKIHGLLSCGLLLLSLACAPLAHGAAPCAHRGDAEKAPENTLAAIRAAVEKGAAMIEFDVHASKDGKLVIIHDATLNRTTNGSGPVSEMDFDAIRALDAGSWFDESFAGAQVPTLEEVLEAIPPGIWCNVHLKNSPGIAAKSAETIARMGRLDDCFLACADTQIAEARAAVAEIKICNMTRQSGNRTAYIDHTIALGCAFIQLHQAQGIEGLKEDVERLHQAGVKINYFGANDAEKMTALKAAGVDYILTDKLDLAREVLAE